MTATLTRRYVERMGGRVDREAGILYRVKLLGRKSRNGREYSERAMSEAAWKYDGKKVYVDHPEKDKLDDDRKFRDWAGVVRNPRYESGAIYGDIHLRTKSDFFEELIEAAEQFGSCFGCSHVADGDSRFDNGTEIIESIESVFSVDLVTEPATAAGLFESGGESLACLDGGWADRGAELCAEVIAMMTHLNERHNANLPVAKMIEIAGLYAAMKQQRERTLESHRRHTSPDRIRKRFASLLKK